MPPAKRPLADVDQDVLAAPSKRVSRGENPKKRERVSAKVQFERSSFVGKYEYICIAKPPYSGTESEDSEGEETQLVSPTPASEHPRWKWIALRESLNLLAAAYQATNVRDPDRFGMYIRNDFFGYGIIEILENMLRAFNKELKPQTGKKYNYQQLWAVVVTLAHYLNSHNSLPWMMVDDGARCERLNGVIGCMILTALNELDRIGQLTAESKFLDLGHVMALFLLWSKTPSENLIEYPVLSNDSDGGEEPETVDWQKTLVAYAKKAQINLADHGVSGISDVLEGIDVGPLEGKTKAERWRWTEVLREYRQDYGWRPTVMARPNCIGGEEHNLLTWSREMRAEHAFDKVDPLAEFTDEQIKSGMIGLA